MPIPENSDPLGLEQGQCCPLELSEMLEMFYICTVQYSSHRYLLSAWNVAGMTQEQNFYF